MELVHFTLEVSSRFFVFDLLWQDFSISTKKWCFKRFAVIPCPAANWWAGIICWARLSSDTSNKSSAVRSWRLLCHSQLSHSKWQGNTTTVIITAAATATTTTLCNLLFWRLLRVGPGNNDYLELLGIIRVISNCLQCFDTIGWVQEEHSACKNWLMGCWHGYLSGAGCKWCAYGSADAATTPSSLASLKIYRMVIFLGRLIKTVL